MLLDNPRLQIGSFTGPRSALNLGPIVTEASVAGMFGGNAFGAYPIAACAGDDFIPSSGLPRQTVICGRGIARVSVFHVVTIENLRME